MLTNSQENVTSWKGKEKSKHSVNYTQFLVEKEILSSGLIITLFGICVIPKIKYLSYRIIHMWLFKSREKQQKDFLQTKGKWHFNNIWKKTQNTYPFIHLFIRE